MSCVLRATGDTFDVDGFLRLSTFKPVVIFHKGERRTEKLNNRTSGFNLTISNARFDRLADQVNDAIMFLESERNEVARLRKFSGVQGMTIDFGIKESDEPAQSEEFPPRLLLLCGELGVSLAFTLYP